MLADLLLAELRDYAPEVAEPADFDDFWACQLSAVRAHPLNATFTKTETAIRHADVFDVTFAGHGGDPIKGWFLVPHQRRGQDPAPATSVPSRMRCVLPVEPRAGAGHHASHLG